MSSRPQAAHRSSISTIPPSRQELWSASRARTREKQEFLAIGPGAEQWLIKAAAAGAGRVRRKMCEAGDLSKLHGHEPVERALSRSIRSTAIPRGAGHGDCAVVDWAAARVTLAAPPGAALPPAPPVPGAAVLFVYATVPPTMTTATLGPPPPPPHMPHPERS